MEINNRPNPNEAFPNPNLPRFCFIKNVVKNPRIIVGDYTYYDDVDGADEFEKHVTHFYDFIGDKLIIGKFCAIAKGVEFVMNGANHRMDCVTTYPFYIMGGDWGSAIAPVKDELPLKGDTIIGNDVWIGQNVTVMCGGQYRGGHAKLWPRLVAGCAAFFCLSTCHDTWSRVQRMA
ncbi:MAG: hypothetical protein K5945_10190 [Bacteroidaceae bacterium]|nr:hypothetical protein [Bacteroidaceae bacterium]